MNCDKNRADYITRKYRGWEILIFIHNTDICKSKSHEFKYRIEAINPNGKFFTTTISWDLSYTLDDVLDFIKFQIDKFVDNELENKKRMSQWQNG